MDAGRQRGIKRSINHHEQVPLGQDAGGHVAESSHDYHFSEVAQLLTEPKAQNKRPTSTRSPSSR